MRYWKANKQLYGIGMESIESLLSHMDIMVIKEVFNEMLSEEHFERVCNWVEEERNKL